MIVGSGGQVIREITETTGAKVDINDQGLIKVSSTDQILKKLLSGLKASPAMEPEVGMIDKGQVVKLMDFGAFVNFMAKMACLVHISELAPALPKPVIL